MATVAEQWAGVEGVVSLQEQERLEPCFSYFTSGKPLKFTGDPTYTEGGEVPKHDESYEWEYPLQDVVCFLISHGLRIEFLHEFPFSCYRQFPNMKKGDDGYWHFRDESIRIPLLFSMKATKT